MEEVDSLNVYILTFNCARKAVKPQILAQSFFDALPEEIFLPDVIVISLQEVAPIACAFLGGSLVEPFFSAVVKSVAVAAAERARNASLTEDGFEPYTHILTRHVGMTAVMIFARAPCKDQIKWITTAGAGVGLWRMGNKGAVAARIAFNVGQDDVELTAVAAHLAPMEWNVPRRQWDFEQIVRNLVFQSDPALPTNWDSAISSVTACDDCDDCDDSHDRHDIDDNDDTGDNDDDTLLLSTSVQPKRYSGIYDSSGILLFAGDLNYRTSDKRPSLTDHSRYPQPTDPVGADSHYLNYLKRDQLTRERENGCVFHHFSEPKISFPPTYKYRPQRLTVYDSAQDRQHWRWAWHRFPSWCDRILYLPSQRVRVHSYKALPIQPTSDHRPVVLSLTVHARRDGVRRTSPFPLNPSFAQDREAAKSREFIVGVLAYLVLTPMGNTILTGLVAGGLAGWYLMHQLLTT